MKYIYSACISHVFYTYTAHWKKIVKLQMTDRVTTAWKWCGLSIFLGHGYSHVLYSLAYTTLFWDASLTDVHGVLVAELIYQLAIGLARFWATQYIYTRLTYRKEWQPFGGPDVVCQRWPTWANTRPAADTLVSLCWPTTVSALEPDVSLM